MIDKIIIAGLSSGLAHIITKDNVKDNLNQNYHLLPRKIFKNLCPIACNENAMWIIDENLVTIEQSLTDYKFDDLRQTDNVLDIGACIGGFALNINKRVNHVYAVEPLFTDSLRRNVALNNTNNVTIMEYALGDNILWGNTSKKVNGLSLKEIIENCKNHIDFIKIDCEGGEWSIKSSELYNIRRLEIEIHNFNNDKNYSDFENMLTLAGFEYTSRFGGPTTILISAKNRYID